MRSRLIMMAAALALLATPAVAQHQLSHNAAPGNPKADGALRFAELVAEKTDGRITIDVGGSAQFGDDTESLTNMRLGTLAFGVNSQGPTSGVIPEYALLGLPFLFQSQEQAWEVMDGAVGEKLAELTEAQGLVLLGLWDNGIRVTSNNVRPIKTPADMAGLKIRTPPSPMALDVFNALGANPGPLAFSELYIALQQGVFDGQENPLTNIHSSKLHEVQRYISVTNHMYEAAILIASKAIFDGFSAEDQAAIREAAKEAGEFNRQRSKSDEVALFPVLKDAGIEFNEVDNIQDFIDATQPVYDKWRKDYPELVDLFVESATAARKK
jgi:tripartite ATP-independent transporter DctP family solute receptor